MDAGETSGKQTQSFGFGFSEALDVMKPCRGWEAGCKRCSEENGRSYLLLVKPASARPLWLTRSPSASLLMGAFGLLEVNVSNSTGLAKRICLFSTRSVGCV